MILLWLEIESFLQKIIDFYPEHQPGNELKFISEWLDKHPDLIDRVKCNISNNCKSNTSTAETIFLDLITKTKAELLDEN